MRLRYKDDAPQFVALTLPPSYRPVENTTEGRDGGDGSEMCAVICRYLPEAPIKRVIHFNVALDSLDCALITEMDRHSI